MTKPHDSSPEKLMIRFQSRPDSHVFSRIVSLFMPPALAAARKILADRYLAEDAVQETFLRVIRQRRQYRPARDFAPWFYTILRNVCLDMLRRRSRHHQALEQIARRAPNPSKPNDSSDILELLEALPCGERDVIQLRIIHSLGFREVAAALDISEEAAKKRAQRGLRRLREKYRDTILAYDAPPRAVNY